MRRAKETILSRFPHQVKAKEYAKSKKKYLHMKICGFLFTIIALSHSGNAKIVKAH